jgi:hypothetical protein
MKKSLQNCFKRLKEKETNLKRQLTTEFAISLEELRKEVEPWIEIVDGKEYVFKKIENIKGFGVITLVFQEKSKFNDGRIFRLNYQLKL